jgi:hypothetical protein
MTCVIALFLIGCFQFSPVSVNTEFTRVGAARSRPPAVDSHQKVRIFCKSSPRGFTLRENELQVEEGYRHVILGELKTRYRTGEWQGGCPTQADKAPPSP